MKCIILAAGFGTRLGEEDPRYQNTPKQLLHVRGSDTVLDVSTEQLAPYVDGFYVVSNNKYARMFAMWAGMQRSGKPARVIDNNVPHKDLRRGSIGDLIYARDQARIDEPVLVVGGDNLFPDLDLGGMIKAFELHHEPTIALYDVQDLVLAQKYGIAQVEGGRVTGFEEKPQMPKSTLASTLVYLLTPKNLEQLDDYAREREVLFPEDRHKLDRAGDFIKWLASNDTVRGFTFEGEWFDIGSVRELERAKDFYRVQRPRSLILP